MSFENPNAPAVYQWQTQPKIEVQFNIGSQKVGDDVHEVVLRIEVTAQSDDRTAFQVELVYAGLFALRNIPEEQLQPFLLAEAPRLLFPFARQVIDSARSEEHTSEIQSLMRISSAVFCLKKKKVFSLQ